MSRIPAHSIDSAPEGTRKTLEALSRRSGKLLNIHAEMAHAPVVLAAYTGLNEAIAAQGTFTPAVKEAIALAVGQVNGCQYCQAAHTQGALKVGFTQEQTLQIRSGNITFDDHLAVLIAVAREAAGQVGNVSDQTWNAALQAGWSELELAELFAHLSVNLFTNFFNHYARTDLDVPAAAPLPGG